MPTIKFNKVTFDATDITKVKAKVTFSTPDGEAKSLNEFMDAFVVGRQKGLGSAGGHQLITKIENGFVVDVDASNVTNRIDADLINRFMAREANKKFGFEGEVTDFPSEDKLTEKFHAAYKPQEQAEMKKRAHTRKDSADLGEFQPRAKSDEKATPEATDTFASPVKSVTYDVLQPDRPTIREIRAGLGHQQSDMGEVEEAKGKKDKDTIAQPPATLKR